MPSNPQSMLFNLRALADDHKADPASRAAAKAAVKALVASMGAPDTER